MEQPKQYTPEEIAEFEKSRTISDAELLKGGAEYAVNEDGEKRLVSTKKQTKEFEQEFKEEERREEIGNYFSAVAKHKEEIQDEFQSFMERYKRWVRMRIIFQPWVNNNPEYLGVRSVHTYAPVKVPREGEIISDTKEIKLLHGDLLIFGDTNNSFEGEYQCDIGNIKNIALDTSDPEERKVLDIEKIARGSKE